MRLVRRLVVCGVCLAGLAPALAAALELGPIEARSALYEPLDARIPVRGAQSGDLEGLRVALGSPAQFELAGVARLQHLGLLEFVVVEDGGGGGYIHVRTDEPIIESSLTFLVDVDWPRGRTVRGYKLRLVSAVGGATDAGSSRRAAPEAQPETDTAPAAPEAQPVSSGSAYGPVRKSETLWSIASRLRPDPSVSTQRMMLAILEANPGAFTIGNVNALRAGATLRIPTRDEIGPDDLRATIAEVQRQHSAWLEHRTSATARAARADPGGRIEVVSPEAATDTTGPKGGAEVSALRRELALATEETDAVRRENDDLRLRLSDVEDRIGELSRLVELKDEEIAALQAELSARSESMPVPAPGPVEVEPSAGGADRVSELNRLVELKDEEIAALRAELIALSETTPAAEPAAAEPTPLPAPVATQPAAPAQSEPKSLPFGLGNLPVNPVFLVGGAGLLLLLLGALALLRRRRASTGSEDEVLDVAETPPSGDDDLLLELEAVAAELADEGDEPPARPSRAKSVDAPDEGIVHEPPVLPATRSQPGDLVEERIAALWRDEDGRAPEQGRPSRTPADVDAAGDTFDIDALAADDSVPVEEVETGDLAAGRRTDSMEAGPGRTAGEATGSPGHIAGGTGAGTTDSEISESVPVAGAGDSTARDLEFPDDAHEDATAATATSAESGMTDEGDGAVGRSAGVAAGGSVARGLERDDTDDWGQPAKSLPDESGDGGGPRGLPLEDVGEDEVQTKIDLAQVYMEMGDAESARGFLEAVLAEGDAEQRDTAREMLSKLS